VQSGGCLLQRKQCIWSSSQLQMLHHTFCSKDWWCERLTHICNFMSGDSRVASISCIGHYVINQIVSGASVWLISKECYQMRFSIKELPLKLKSVSFFEKTYLVTVLVFLYHNHVTPQKTPPGVDMLDNRNTKPHKRCSFKPLQAQRSDRN